jgi:hypothetical protein
MLTRSLDRMLDWVWAATETISSKTAVFAFWRGISVGMVLMALLLTLG